MKLTFDTNCNTTLDIIGKGQFASSPCTQASADFVGFFCPNAKLTMTKKEEARLNAIDNFEDLEDFVAEIKCGSRVEFQKCL